MNGLAEAVGPAVFAGSVASLCAGLATGIGAMPILGLGRLGRTQENLMLGFAAGVMLAASFFSLIVPALELARENGSGQVATSATVVTAVIAGAVLLSALERYAPAIDRIAPVPAGGGVGAAAKRRSVWLMIVAITLHNIPEGAAVGMSFAHGRFADGLSTTTGIAVQNIPEGLAVAGAFATLGYGRVGAFLGGLGSGLVEPVAGVASAVLVAHARTVLPWGLGMAAGAMIFIVVAQILPDVREQGGGRLGTPGFFAGLATMLFLDTALG